MRKATLLLTLLVLFAGCATIVSGPSQTVSVHSTPEYADVWIDGIYYGKTPIQVSLSTESSHTVRLELPGYHPYETQVIKTINGWVWGNLLLGGVIGIVVDVATGSIYKLTPSQIRAHLKKEKGNASTPLSDGLHIFFVKKPHHSWQKIASFTPSAEMTP